VLSVGSDGCWWNLGVVEDLDAARAEITSHEGGASGVDEALQALPNLSPRGGAACGIIDEFRERQKSI
jgi:hypothetical protein